MGEKAGTRKGLGKPGPAAQRPRGARTPTGGAEPSLEAGEQSEVRKGRVCRRPGQAESPLPDPQSTLQIRLCAACEGRFQPREEPGSHTAAMNRSP